MKVRFTTKAKRELYGAVSYYNSLRSGLGYELAIEVDSGIDKIDRFPDAWMLLKGDLRRYLIRRFPFGIIYTIQNNSIIILSIMNLHQDPEKWETLS